MRVAYPRPGGDLQRGRAAQRGRRCASSSRSPMPTIYEAIDRRRRAARPTARWSRSRTRSRARCARPSTRSPSTPRRWRSSASTTTRSDQPDRRAGELELERDRGGDLPPAGRRAVRALPARPSCRRRRSGRRRAPPRRCARSPSRERPWAALGAASAADDLRLRGPPRGSRGRARQRHPLRLAGAGAAPSPRATATWRTTLVFSELGDDHPGALVDALTEFSSREVNLTRIESRPLRAAGLGRYMFFCRPRGPRRATRPSPRRSRALRGKAETVRVLGSYPLAAAASPVPEAADAAAGYNSRRPWRPGRGPRGSRGRRRSPSGGARAGPGPQRQLRADQRLHGAPRDGPAAEGEGRDARARATGACTPSGWSSSGPCVIRLVSYVRVPRDVHRRKITRKAVLARDSWTCQYCGHERRASPSTT